MNYVANKHADIGFVALSQLIYWQHKHDLNLKDEIWIVPQKLYTPIEQKVVILKKANKEAAQKFLNFVKSQQAQKVLTKYGYR